jgi:hypothetical protein
MDRDNLLSPEEIRGLFDLNVETGELRWKASTSRGQHTQRVAGSDHRLGYRQVKIGKKGYLVHRVVWAIVHGEWPAKHVDHIDGNKANNAVTNLRLATVGQNAQNRAVTGVKSVSGLMGAVHVPGTSRRREKWESRIKVNGVSKHLGCFTTPQAAHEAYMQAKAKFHPYFSRASA